MPPQKYVLLYLIYGLAFINLGVAALQHSNHKESNFALVNNIKFLGYFGLAHGLTELVTMLVLTELYQEFYIQMFLFNRVLKALSFLSLFIFGIRLLEIKYRKYLYTYIVIVFSIWLSIFLITGVKYGFEYHITQPIFNIVLLRYFMALPGGVLTFFALFTDSKAVEKTKLYNMVNKYRAFALAFLIYGLLDGLVVRNNNFFPANIINNDSFKALFGIPVQVVKTIIGVTINILFLRVLYIFNWETNEKIEHLTKLKVRNEERKRLGREIHDNIIQNLYATGLKLELATNSTKDHRSKTLLQETKNSINESMKTIREFMVGESDKIIDVEELRASIEVLIAKYHEIIQGKIIFNYKVPHYNMGNLSTENATQIYYIIQEALSNVAKHSNSSKVSVSLTSSIKGLQVEVKDNGQGFDISKTAKDRVGLKSMIHRANQINGTIEIKAEIGEGTKIKLTVSWEEPDE